MKTVAILTATVLFFLSFYFWQENQQLKLENTNLKEELEQINFVLSSIQNTLPQDESNPDKNNNLQQILAQYLTTNANADNPPTISSEQLQKQQIPNKFPIIDDYAISQKFSAKHQAIDLAAELGSQVVSAGLGAVISVSSHPQLGNMVEIDHLNGYRTRYAHLVTAIVESGQLIKQGETLGFVGNTGRSSAAHLHFEMFKDGKKIDPLTVLRRE